MAGFVKRDFNLFDFRKVIYNIVFGRFGSLSRLIIWSLSINDSQITENNHRRQMSDAQSS